MRNYIYKIIIASIAIILVFQFTIGKEISKINNKQINIINVNFKNSKAFEKISSKDAGYIFPIYILERYIF